MAFEKQMEVLSRKTERALAMGGREKVKRQHDQGRQTARERIDALLEPNTFCEVGMFAHSDVPGMEDITPADSKVVGYGRIEGRPVGVIANDFTVMGATSSRVAGRKEGVLKAFCAEYGFPIVYLGESGGARMPDIMGSVGLASFGGEGFDLFNRIMSRVRRSPFVSGIFGKCYGMPTWMACLSDFVVQVKGSSMAVSGPRVLKIAQSESITDEELGGSQLHAKITGMSDRVAEDEQECLALIRQYLSYMPSHNQQLPPLARVPKGSGRDMGNILAHLPENRKTIYDMNRILECIFDAGSLFPIKPKFGRTVITSLARIDGMVAGIIANQPAHNLGAMDTDGIDKVLSFLCLCDSFNIPIAFFVDIPGFLVGRKAERNRVAARVMNFMNALALVTVPKISVIIRKCYGMAFYNMGGTGTGTHSLVAWPTAEMSFVDPIVAANVVFGGGLAETEQPSEDKQALVEKMVEDTSPFGAAGLSYIHDVIDPRETRNHIIQALRLFRESRTQGIGEHKLANWPTKF